MVEIEIVVPELPKQPKSPRYQPWVGLFVFSIVGLTAHASKLPDKSFRNGPQKWVLAVLCLSFIFSFFAVLAHYIKPEMFVGEKAEGFLASFLLILWVAGIPPIMKPKNCIAVCQFDLGSGTIGGVSNTNLYFSAWAALVCILFVWGHYGQELALKQYTQELPTKKPKTTQWYALLAASVVVLASSAQYHTSFCGSGETCSRNAWAISLGCIASLASAGMVFMATRKQLTNMIELITSGVLLLMYIFGVAFITFGKGSGVVIGNLYFSTWAGFVISGMLASAAFKKFISKRAEQSLAEANAAPAPTKADIEGGDGDEAQAPEAPPEAPEAPTETPGAPTEAVEAE